MNAVTPTSHLDEKTRKANRRLALVLGLVAVGLYLLMILFNPQ